MEKLTTAEESKVDTSRSRPVRNVWGLIPRHVAQAEPGKGLAGERSQADPGLVGQASTQGIADPSAGKYVNLGTFEKRCEDFGPTRNMDPPMS